MINWRRERVSTQQDARVAASDDNHPEDGEDAQYLGIQPSAARQVVHVQEHDPGACVERQPVAKCRDLRGAGQLQARQQDPAGKCKPEENYDGSASPPPPHQGHRLRNRDDGPDEGADAKQPPDGKADERHDQRPGNRNAWARRSRYLMALPSRFRCRCSLITINSPGVTERRAHDGRARPPEVLAAFSSRMAGIGRVAESVTLSACSDRVAERTPLSACSDHVAECGAGLRLLGRVGLRARHRHTAIGPSASAPLPMTADSASADEDAADQQSADLVEPAAEVLECPVAAAPFTGNHDHAVDMRCEREDVGGDGRGPRIEHHELVRVALPLQQVHHGGGVRRSAADACGVREPLESTASRLTVAVGSVTPAVALVVGREPPSRRLRPA